MDPDRSSNRRQVEEATQKNSFSDSQNLTWFSEHLHIKLHSAKPVGLKPQDLKNLDPNLEADKSLEFTGPKIDANQQVNFKNNKAKLSIQI
jgi:hypothetical protein